MTDIQVVRYIAGNGARFNDERAQVYGEWFEGVFTTYGYEITAPEILELAKGSPLEVALEWNDAVAAREYRLTQIRTIMNSIDMIWVSSDGQERRGKAFDSEVRHRGYVYHGRQVTKAFVVYVQTQEIVKSDVRRKALLLAVLKRVIGHLNQYRDYQELDPAFGFLNGLMDEIEQRPDTDAV